MWLILWTWRVKYCYTSQNAAITPEYCFAFLFHNQPEFPRCACKFFKCYFNIYYCFWLVLLNALMAYYLLQISSCMFVCRERPTRLRSNRQCLHLQTCDRLNNPNHMFGSMCTALNFVLICSWQWRLSSKQRLWSLSLGQSHKFWHWTRTPGTYCELIVNFI